MYKLLLLSLCKAESEVTGNRFRPETVFRWAVRWAPCPNRTLWIWKPLAIGIVWCAAGGHDRRCRRCRRSHRWRCIHCRWRRHRHRRLRRKRHRKNRRRCKHHRRWSRTAKKIADSWPNCCSRIWADSRRSVPSVSALPICRFECARPDKLGWCRWPSWLGNGSATGSGRASPADRPDRSASNVSGNINAHVRFEVIRDSI